jgi:glycosyltransferase involved in cell wall biosynthesis
MNVIFIGPFGLQPKSTMSRRALPLARALVGRGHVVTVLIPPWDDVERAGQHWEDGGVEVVNVPLPAAHPGLFQFRLTRNLVTRALALKPDVIHFFKPKAYAGLAHLALWWLRWAGTARARLVVDADDWEQAWNDQPSYSGAQKRVFAWQEQWGLRHADAVTVASLALEEMVKAQRRAERSNVYYVPNGFPTGVLTATEVQVVDRQLAGYGTAYDHEVPQVAPDLRLRWRLGQAAVILLYTRFSEFRVERMVTLVALVAQRLPEARWVIVGQGLHGEERLLAGLLARAGLEEYTRFTGWQPADQLPAYFELAAVAAFPCDDTLINRTKCSVKAIDLLAAGLPVVADTVGQNCEYIHSDISGVLVPAEDDSAFAEALVELLQAPAKRYNLGRAAARRIREKYDWSKLSQVVERAYG